MALPTPTTPIAKSLHTLTVLQQVARVFQQHAGVNDTSIALDCAMSALGLSGRPDPYGLQARALVLLMKDAA